MKMLDLEFGILEFIQKYMTASFLDPIIVAVTTLGNAGAIWILLALGMMCNKKYRSTGIVLAIGLIMSLLIGNIILKPLVARLRPFQIREVGELLITAPSDYSFPSGHTLSSFICATILLIRERKIGYGALSLSILIAFSRLYLYVHFPSDVAAAVVMGVAIGFLSNIISKKFILKNRSI